MAIGLALVASAAFGADRKPRSGGNWVSEPSPEEAQAALAKVVSPGQFYRAVIGCKVADDGGLSDCRVTRETPVGSGFGAAILALTPKYRRKPPGPRDPREIALVEEWSQFDKEPDWLKRPTAEDLLSVFPTEAYRRGQNGKAIINCIATTQGGLKECVTLEETPPGAGFGAAAIALTPQFTMRPALLKGAPVQSVVSIPINFITYGPGDTFGSKKVITSALAWTAAPTFAEVAAAYPAKARTEKRGGRATLSCAMTEAGRLSSCDVAASAPKGYGFEAAAKALSKHFAFPVTSDAERKATRSLQVHLPVTFDPAMLDQASPVVGKPSRAALPEGERVVEAFKDVKVAGTARASLGCAIQAGGQVGDCRVLSETPAGAGVGAAALKLAPHFRLTTWTAEGLPVVGGRISIPIRYESGPGS